MKDISWLFSGIGTEFVKLLISFSAGFLFHKILIRKRYRQKQIAGNNSQQIQYVSDNEQRKEHREEIESDIQQLQSAGHNSIQIASIKNGNK